MNAPNGIARPVRPTSNNRSNNIGIQDNFSATNRIALFNNMNVLLVTQHSQMTNKISMFQTEMLEHQ